MSDEPTPRFAIAEALFSSMAGGSSGLDDMLEGICHGHAHAALAALTSAGYVVVRRGQAVDHEGNVCNLEEVHAAIDTGTRYVSIAAFPLYRLVPVAPLPEETP